MPRTLAELGEILQRAAPRGVDDVARHAKALLDLLRRELGEVELDHLATALRQLRERRVHKRRAALEQRVALVATSA